MTTTINITDLFAPLPPGVSLDPTTPVPDGTWMSTLLTTAQTLGLDTTAWQPGAPERTILAVCAVSFAQEDVIISLMAQGGLLDFAASGTVTATAVDGTTTVVKVTPDPSIPSENPTATPGWLDAIGQSFFRQTRFQATSASGQLAIANTSASTLNYSAGAYHVANTVTGATYGNSAALSVPPSAIAGSGGIITGIATGVSPTVTTSAAHGLAVGDVVYITGVVGVNGINGKFAAVTNVPSPTTFILAITTSGSWTSGGTVYKCTLANMAADAVGIGGNAAPGQVTTQVTTNVGVSVYNLTSWSAANYESNTAYADRCRLSLGALSPNGPSEAYEYFALSAQAILAAQSPPVAMTNGPIVRATVILTPSTQMVTTIVASSTPAGTVLGTQVTPGCADLDITGASNATPIVITTASAHGLANGDAVIVSGVLGNANANGAFTVSVLSPTTFQLVGSVGSGAYTGGGVVDGGDLGQVDALIHANVVPDSVTAKTQSAAAFPVNISATVVVPQAFAATYQAAAPVALAALFATFDIGGDPDVGNAILLSAVQGALFDAGVPVVGQASYVKSVTGLTLNGVAADLPFPSAYHYAILLTPTINTIGV